MSAEYIDSHVSALSTQQLSTQHSVLSTQYSVLSTQYFLFPVPYFQCPSAFSRNSSSVLCISAILFFSSSSLASFAK